MNADKRGYRLMKNPKRALKGSAIAVNFQLKNSTKAKRKSLKAYLK
jgi:hypothetical protein